MRVAIISVYPKLSSDGSRLISALLKRAGHQVKCVFLPRITPHDYESQEIQQLDGVLKDVDLVLMAVYSTYLNRALKVTEFIRKKFPKLKVIWGGPHCIGEPRMSLTYADGVCYSEADEAIVELVNRMEKGKDYLNTQSMAFNIDGRHIVNSVRPPLMNLDTLPHYDYDMEGHFVLDRKLSPMTKQLIKRYSPHHRHSNMPVYLTLTTRGCPFQCSFCNNVRYVNMFGSNRLRFRSVDHVMEELKDILQRFDFFEGIAIGDDDFFARPTSQIEEFAQKYKKHIGLPFGVTVTANSYNQGKLEMLLDSGLCSLEMGVESASQRINDEIFDRKIQVSKTKEVAHQLKPYRETHRLTLMLDFIIDNPYETEEDILKAYHYILDVADVHPWINLYKLGFPPGTPLYHKAIKEGLIEPFSVAALKGFAHTGNHRLTYQNNYATFLLVWINTLLRLDYLKYFPRSILKILASRPIRKIASIIPKKIYGFMANRLLAKLIGYWHN